MSDVLTKARYLLAQAEATKGLPAAGQLRMSNMILEHAQLREVLHDLLEFHEGYAQEHRTLVRMVFELAKTAIASSNGQLKWATEIPPGTAPQFRRALNDLLKYLREACS